MYKLLKLNIIGFLILGVFTFGFITPVLALSSSDYDALIDQEKDNLNKTKDDIAYLNSLIEANKNAIENMQDGLPKTLAQIEEMELQLELNRSEYDVIKQAYDLSELEKAKLEFEQSNSLISTYKSWKSSNDEVSVLTRSNRDFILKEEYSRRIFGFGNSAVKDFSNKIDELEVELKDFEKIISKLEEEEKKLNDKKAELESKINSLNSVIAYSGSQINQLESQAQSIEQNIDLLTAEQQIAKDKEDDILSNSDGSMPDPDPTTGNFYFYGKGRDLYQGHGVGMSQWGAHGAALSGMSYQDILMFYFQNSTISSQSGTVNIIGGPQGLNIEEYIKGLGEVPDKACGTAEQAASNPSKYVEDDPNSSWDCWPEEAIKAQVVTARSYALYNRDLYPDARSQVWDPNTYNKTWAQQETSGQVVKSGGSVINALYSSDNNQGSGTANNDTIFQDIEGNGWPQNYLRASNDNSFATLTSWTNWQYNTRAYYMSEIEDLFSFTAGSSSGYSQSIRNYISSVSSTVGEIQSINFERDPSGRVKKVVINGSGGSKKIGGWWFKNIWNNWVYTTGTNDYIYSQTFYTAGV